MNVLQIIRKIPSWLEMAGIVFGGITILTMIFADSWKLSVSLLLTCFALMLASEQLRTTMDPTNIMAKFNERLGKF